MDGKNIKSVNQRRLDENLHSSGTTDTPYDDAKTDNNRGRLDRALTGVPLTESTVSNNYNIITLCIANYRRLLAGTA
jgi:hypothetical protein